MSHTSSISTVPIKSVSALRAAIAELVQQGINVTLEANAVPRMYYNGQIAKHVQSAEQKKAAAGEETLGLQFHDNPDECDYVVRVKDAYYDIALIKNDKGHLVPFFDDYNSPSRQVPATQSGKGPIRDFLGADYEGRVEHWSGLQEDTEGMKHAVGRLMQGYSKHATVEAASVAGQSIMSTATNDAGELVMTIAVN